MVVCFVVYVACEIVVHIIGMDYLAELIALFIGTLSIGGFIGFLIGLIISNARK